MPKSINYTGMKFGHLTLLSYSKPGGKGVGAYWTARCDCGVVKDVIAKAVVHGRIKTCGECPLVRDLGRFRMPSLKAGERKLYMRYLTKAATKKIPWDLSPEQFRDIIGKPCVYCATNPSLRLKGTKLVYNGIDRLVSAGGYTLENSAPCCGDCRSFKGDMNYQEFVDHTIKIATTVIEKMHTARALKGK